MIYILILFLSCFNVLALTQGDFDYSVNSGKVTITKYNGRSASLEIPGQIGGLPVTAIGNGAFTWNSSLVSINIPESITSIGDSAFLWCFNLTSISISNNLTELGSGAFENCYDLFSISLPPNITRIKSNTFKYSGLRSVDLPSNLVAIEDSAFEGAKLTNLTLPASLTNIGTNAFRFCDFISVEIPEGVTVINNGAFDFCMNLSYLKLPSSLIEIKNEAFNYCTGLTELVIPDNVTIINSKAFNECDNLNQITLGKKVSRIGSEAFRGCRALGCVSIPPSVTRIEKDAFEFCTSLQTVYFLGNQPNPNALTPEDSKLTTYYYRPGTSGWTVIRISGREFPYPREIPVTGESDSASGNINSPFNYQINAIGSARTYYAIDLPHGLSLDTSTGLITGTPTSAGTYQVYMFAANETGGGAAYLTLTISKTTPVIISYPTASPINDGETLLTSGLSGGLADVVGSFRWASPTFVPGVGTSPQRVIFIPANSSQYSELSLSINVSVVGLAISSDLSSVSLRQGSNYFYQITGNGSPTSFQATGLPKGLSVNRTSGRISGAPSQTGTFSVSLQALKKGSTTATATKVFTVVQVPTFSYATRINAQRNKNVNVRPKVAGSPAPSFSVVSGSLPPGLSLNASTAAITGKPTTAGSYAFTVRGSNSAGNTDRSTTIVVK